MKEVLSEELSGFVRVNKSWVNLEVFKEKTFDGVCVYPVVGKEIEKCKQ